MSISSTANQVIKTIRDFKNAIKNSIVAFSTFFIHFITHLPQNIPLFFQGVWSTFKAGLNLGQEALLLLLRATKYLVTHFTDVLRAIYESAVFLLKHIPDVIQFAFDVTKEITKAIFNNALAIGKWFIRNLPHLFTHTIGFILGAVYAAFELTADLLKGIYNTVFNRQSNNAPSVTTRRNIDSFQDDQFQSPFAPASNLTYQFNNIRNQSVTNENARMENTPISKLRLG